LEAKLNIHSDVDVAGWETLQEGGAVPGGPIAELDREAEADGEAVMVALPSKKSQGDAVQTQGRACE